MEACSTIIVVHEIDWVANCARLRTYGTIVGRTRKGGLPHEPIGFY